MHTEDYIVNSLELHLFFGRIMKEHSFFLKAGFMPPDASFSRQAGFYKAEFERLLCRAIALSEGVISKEVLCSGELVTEFTALAERQTENYTGIPIHKGITQRELRMRTDGCRAAMDAQRQCQVRELNRTALRLLDGLIGFKETVLKNVLCCKMFTANYPLLIEHIIREAKLYQKYIRILEDGGDVTCQSMREIECFWNQIMMEHAMFIRGLLDPTEDALLTSADRFAKEYAELLNACQQAQDQTLTSHSLQETIKFRDFKAAGAQGIEQCKVRSIILPLLADHVLREANHYIRLLQS